MDANGLARVARGAAEDAGGLDATLLGDFLEVDRGGVAGRAAAAPPRARGLRRAGAGGRRGRCGAAGAGRPLPVGRLAAVARAAAAHGPAARPSGSGGRRTRARRRARRAALRRRRGAGPGGGLPARPQRARPAPGGRAPGRVRGAAGRRRPGRGGGRTRLGAGPGPQPARTAVLVAAPLHEDVPPAAPLLGRVEAALAGSRGDAPPLVSVRDGDLVCVVAAPDDAATRHVVARVQRRARPGLARRDQPGAAWGRPACAPPTSRPATACSFASRLGLPGSVLDPAQLALYRVLLRDRAAIERAHRDRAGSAERPLGAAPGRCWRRWRPTSPPAPTPPAPPSGCTCRCARSPTGSRASPSCSAGTRPTRRRRFALEAAVLGARLLDWPRVATEPRPHCRGSAIRSPAKSSGRCTS